MKKLLALAGSLVLAGSLAPILTACGSDDSSVPKAPPPQADSNPYTDPIKAEGSSPARLDGDGRYFGFIRSADSGSRTISFDVGQFFFGEARQDAAEEDGVVAPGEPVSNDHYERNPVPVAEDLELSKDVEVTASIASRLDGVDCPAECPYPVQVTPADFFSSFEKDRNGRTAAGGPFWVTIRDGLVVRIDEQYFP